MLYYLGQLGESLTAFNVFRYITFRVAAAMITALILSWLLGPWFIRQLRRLSVGQNIRDVLSDIQYSEFELGLLSSDWCLIKACSCGRPSRCSTRTHIWST